jgi:hypothetical protein
MTTRVRDLQEISINGVRYRLGGDDRVHTTVSSQYPQKQVFGDIDKDSNPRTSVVVWDDWRGGVGAYSTDGKEDMNQSHFSRANGRQKNHLTLPPLYTAGADSGVAGSTTAINELGTKLYVAIGNGRKIHSYTPSSNTWSSELHSVGTSLEQNIAFTLSGTDYIAYAFTTGYTYTSDGASWTDDTTDVISFAFWDERLWGIDKTGQLWFSTVIGTEVNDAKLPLPDGYAHVLFVGPDAEGNDILYVATEIGLWAHDAANSRFVRTKLQFPRIPDVLVGSGKTQGATTWNADIYITYGAMSVYRYDPVRGVAVSIGLNRDGGFSLTTIRGDITALLPSHTGVIAVMDGVINADSTIWEYTGVGWHYLARSDSSVLTQNAHISSLEGYRLYHVFSTDDIGHITLQSDKVNPDIDSISYEGTNNIGDLITPWFNAGQNEIDKLAVRLRIECTGMSSTETVKVEFGLDYSNLYQASTFTVTADDVTIGTFPAINNNNNEAGSVFRAIRFRLTLNRGSTATNTPNVKSLSLEWRRKIPARYGITCDLDRRERYGGKSPKQQKASLITAVESSTQVEVVFVDDDGNTQNRYMDIVQMEDIQSTGRSEAGITRIVAFEN